MIDDKELRELFKAESEEHLQHLDAGLLRLETHPDDQATLAEVFREAHSLKGAARMLGVSDVETLAHRFEDMLGAARRGETVLAPETLDRLYGGLDAMRKLVHEAVTGEPAGVKVVSLLAQLSDAASGVAAESTPPANRREPSAHSADTAQEAERTAEDGLAQTHRYHIETMRVDPQKLDALMTQAGELTVTKIRLARRLAEMEEIVAFWEEWSRETFANRFGRSAARLAPSRNGARGTSHDEAQRLRSGHERERERLEQLGVLLNRWRSAAYEDNARLDFVANALDEGIRTIRLLPLSTIFQLFPRMVRDLARDQSKAIQLVIEGGETTADKRILEEMKDPLMHIIRNAIDHGIEAPEARARGGKPHTAGIRLRASQTATNIVIEVSDDGRGLDLETIQHTALRRRVCREDELAVMTPTQIQSLIFASGFSTSALVTDVSGRGVGLDVVRTTVERLKGSIQVDSAPGVGCTFRVQLPMTLATMRVLIVSVDRRIYALPVECVQTLRLVAPQEIFAMEGRQTIVLDGHPVSVARLAELLELPSNGSATRSQGPGTSASPQTPELLPCIILAIGAEQLGLFVEALVDEQEVVLKPHSAILQRVRNVAGATILETGEVCIVLNPHDLLRTAQKRAAPVTPEERAMPEAERQRVILLVEDSITTRTQEKRILESGGYEVITAVDGVDAFNKLQTRAFDGVVSDIQMPHMDGLTLTARIRQDKQYQELPIILVTALATEEDKRRGIEVGANAYITKPTFDQKVLLDTLQRLV